MKRLKIYKENGEIVMERTNENNKTTKRLFLAEEDLIDALNAYNYVIHDYEVEVSEEVFALAVNHLTRKAAELRKLQR